ncbi:PadR family transcriptional regulator [Microbacterium sp. A82]|uniref:PadR family transcriptional regulator n=1 Tax=Microbacterium sp. A82 TaxID=3450452 RepID=UPI003F2F4867
MSQDLPRAARKNVLGLAVLAYLTQQPMHAYELYRQLKNNDAAKTFKLSYGALYGVVKQLAEAEMIVAAGTGRTGKLPKHTVYELTDAGRVETRAWLRDLIENPPAEFPSLSAALSLVAILAIDEAVESLRTRQRQNQTEASALAVQAATTIAGGVHPIFLVEDDYRIALLRAESEFIDTLIRKITSTGWAPFWNSRPDPTR